MARRKRRKSKKGSSGGGGWITTFSDLMSLLLTFFILLFSMSSVNGEKFEVLSSSMSNIFVGSNGQSLMEESVLHKGGQMSKNNAGEDAIRVPEEVAKMYNQAVELIEEKDLVSNVSVSRDQEGVYLDIQESILFESGQAEVTPEGKETLNVLKELLELSSNEIVIEGYTDNVPMNTVKYPSNWELSTGRAVSVLRYLVEEQGVKPERLSAKGYGEFRPAAPNDTPKNREKNRRVNIVIVYDPENENKMNLE